MVASSSSRPPDRGLPEHSVRCYAERARYLTHAVGTKIEADAGVFVGDLRQRLTRWSTHTNGTINSSVTPLL